MGKSKDILDFAALFIGTAEGSDAHKEILHIYNSLNPVPRGYKLSVHDPWCAGFVSAVAIMANCTDIIPCECSCTRMMYKAKELGIWKPYTTSFVPPEASIIMWDWDATKANGPDHVGYVVEADNNRITVIDGNWNNKVALRTVEYKNIHGYIIPKYEDNEAEETQFIKCPHCGKNIYFKGE